jgi:DNA-directed RNA polymerase specialized sigma24 family protein
MRDRNTVRGRTVQRSQAAGTQPRRSASGLDLPGAFQLTLLRALELGKAHREIFLLKEIQGHSLAEIAAILGISIDAARMRWKRARREFMHLGDSGVIERSQ